VEGGGKGRAHGVRVGRVELREQYFDRHIGFKAGDAPCLLGEAHPARVGVPFPEPEPRRLDGELEPGTGE
jgi:hypothetical protein